MTKAPAMLLFLLLILFSSACSVKKPQEKPETAPPPPIISQSLPQVQLLELAADFSTFNGQAGLYAKNLKNGQTLFFQQDIVFPTASTHKLVVAAAVYKYLYSKASLDEQQYYDEKIRQMIITSDNPAFYELLEGIEKKQPDALTRVLSDLHLIHTRIHDRESFAKYGYHSVTTPYEMSLVLEAIYQEEYLGKEFSSILKEELGNTIFQEEIPRFLPGKKILHKVGELPGVQCDVGIIDDAQDLVLISIYTTTEEPPPYASDFIARTSAKIYQTLKK